MPVDLEVKAAAIELPVICLALGMFPGQGCVIRISEQISDGWQADCLLSGSLDREEVRQVN